MKSGEACPKCANLPARHAIESAGALIGAIRLARDALGAGVLRDISPSNGPSGNFRDLSDVAPWPEFVEHYLQCNNCQRSFRLPADTLNRIEGEWEPY